MAKIIDANVDFAAANLMSFGKTFATLNGQPLLKSEVWSSYAEAEAFAKTASAYVGQKIVVVDEATNTVKHYGIELDGSLKEIGAALDVYTKEETDSAIASAVSAADHLKRKVVDTKEKIDTTTEDALQYIYMVPSGLTEDDNKYYEYIVIEETTTGENEETTTTRKLEKIGSWEVSLDDYAKTADVNEALAKKVDVEEGKGLSTNDFTTDEKIKLSSLQPIYQVESDIFKIADGTNELQLKEVPQDRVTGLTKKTWANTDKYREVSGIEGSYEANKYYILNEEEYVLDDSESFDASKTYYERYTELVASTSVANLNEILVDATETQSGFITPLQVQKLNALVIDEDGSVGISGKVNASNVEGLDAFITTSTSVSALNTRVGSLENLINNETAGLAALNTKVDNLETSLNNYVLKTTYDDDIVEIKESIIWGSIASAEE